MLGVLLTILKILLIIVLSVIGLALLIILIVLFVPIRYMASGEFEESYSASAKVRWLCISFSGGIKKGSKFFYRIKLFGFCLAGNDEEFIEKQNRKEEKRKNKAARKARKQARKNQEKLGILETSKVQEVQDIQEVQNVQEVQEVQDVPKVQDKEAVQAIEESQESGELQEVQEPDWDSKNSKKRKEKKKKEKKKIEKTDKEEDVEKESFIEKLKTKREHIEKFLQKPYTKNTIARCKKSILKIIKKILPRKARGKLRFGLKNPADTGYVTGICGLFLPLYSGFLQVTPDFYNAGIEGNIWFKGRFCIASIIFPAARIYFSKDFKKTLALAKKI